MDHPLPRERRAWCPAVASRAVRIITSAGTPQVNSLTPDCRYSSIRRLHLASFQCRRLQKALVHSLSYSVALFLRLWTLSGPVALAAAAAPAAASCSLVEAAYWVQSVHTSKLGFAICAFCCWISHIISAIFHLLLCAGVQSTYFSRKPLPAAQATAGFCDHPSVRNDASGRPSSNSSRSTATHTVNGGNSPTPLFSKIHRGRAALLVLLPFSLACLIFDKANASSAPSHKHPTHRSAVSSVAAGCERRVTASPGSFTWPGRPRPCTAVPATVLRAGSRRESVAHTGEQQPVYSRARRQTHYSYGSPLRARTLLLQQQQQRVALLQQCGSPEEKRALLGVGRTGQPTPAAAAGALMCQYARPGTQSVNFSYLYHPGLVGGLVPQVGGAGGAPTFAPAVPAPFEYPGTPFLAPVTYAPTVFPVIPAIPPLTPSATECLDCEKRAPAVVTAVRPSYHPYASAAPPAFPYATVWHERRASRAAGPYGDTQLHISPRVHMSGRLVHSHSSTPIPRGPSAAAAGGGSWASGPPRAASRPAVASRSAARTRSVSSREAVAPPRASVHVIRGSAHGVSADGGRAPAGVAVPGEGARYYTTAVSRAHTTHSSLRRGASLAPALIAAPHEAAPWAYRRYSYAQSAAGQPLSTAKPLRDPRSGGPFPTHAVVSPLTSQSSLPHQKGLHGSRLSLDRAASSAVSYKEKGTGEEKQGRERHTPSVKGGILSRKAPERRKKRKKDAGHQEVVTPLEAAGEAWADEDAGGHEEEEEEEEEEQDEHEEQEEEEEPEEEEEDEVEHGARPRENMQRKQSKERLMQQSPSKFLEWDYSRRGEDWAVGRGGCASHVRQSPINIDETQQPLPPEEAAVLEEQRRDQERRRSRNEQAAASARKRKGTSSAAKSSGSWAKGVLRLPTNLLVDATDDETKVLQLRLGTDIERYLVNLQPGKKVEFEPEKYNSATGNTSRKRRELISSFGFVRTAGKIYDVINFHFHAPAEHTFNMRRRDLELHIVCEHTASDMLVVAVTFEGVKAPSLAGLQSRESTTSSKKTDTGLASSARRGGAQPRSAAGSRSSPAAGRSILQKKRGPRKLAATSKKGKRLKSSLTAVDSRQLDRPPERDVSRPAVTTGKAPGRRTRRAKEQGREEGAQPRPSTASDKEESESREKGETTKGATARKLVTPGAHKFLAAVAEAILVTQRAQRTVREEHEVEKSMRRKAPSATRGEKSSRTAAAVSRRRLASKEGVPEEEEEPFAGRYQESAGPWLLSRHPTTYSLKSTQKWGPWTGFSSTSTTVSSQESIPTGQKEMLFPLLRTLPPAPPPEEAERAPRRSKKRSRETVEDGARDQAAEEVAEAEEAGNKGPTAAAALGEEEKIGRKAPLPRPAREQKEIRVRTSKGKQRKENLRTGQKEPGLPSINLQGLLADKSRDYYRYDGSLTTPPCSETVLWYVLKEPLYVEADLIEVVRKVLQPPGQGHPGAYRVLQNAEGRDNNREPIYMVKVVA